MRLPGVVAGLLLLSTPTLSAPGTGGKKGEALRTLPGVTRDDRAPGQLSGINRDAVGGINEATGYRSMKRSGLLERARSSQEADAAAARAEGGVGGYFKDHVYIGPDMTTRALMNQTDQEWVESSISASPSKQVAMGADSGPQGQDLREGHHIKEYKSKIRQRLLPEPTEIPDEGEGVLRPEQISMTVAAAAQLSGLQRKDPAPQEKPAGQAESADEPEQSLENDATKVVEERPRSAEDLVVDFVFTWSGAGHNSTEKDFDQLSTAEKNATSRGADSSTRFVDTGEIKFALRSVATNAPWFRRIYLVVADHEPVPAWLRATHKTLYLVRHSMIFPRADVLPTHNSYAIEAALHKIPGLAEHFVYLNDDMFVGAPVTKGTFFTDDGKPKVWFDREIAPEMVADSRTFAKLRKDDPYMSGIAVGDRQRADDSYIVALRNDNNLVSKALDKHTMRNPRFAGQISLHQAKPMTVSWMEEVEQIFQTNFEATRSHKFRSVDDVFAFHLAAMMGVQMNECVHERAPRNMYFDMKKVAPSLLAYIVRQQKPLLFCTNDAPSTSYQAVMRALEKLFESKAPFEIKSAV